MQKADVRILVAATACLLALATACSSEPAASPAPTPTAAPAPRATSNIVVSDAVPSLEELRDLGLSESAAKCFIATIDPEGTGRVSSADLFLEAWANCL